MILSVVKINENHNKEMARKFPKATPISRLEFTFSCSKKDFEKGQKAKAIQFPFRLAKAVTQHKIQGQTIYPSNVLVTNFRNVLQAAMAYVTLGRVTNLDQLFILDDLHAEKIYPNILALKALKDLEYRALNDSIMKKSTHTVPQLSSSGLLELPNFFGQNRKNRGLTKKVTTLPRFE